jgi:hypothetical protein
MVREPTVYLLFWLLRGVASLDFFRNSVQKFNSLFALQAQTRVAPRTICQQIASCPYSQPWACLIPNGLPFNLRHRDVQWRHTVATHCGDTLPPPATAAY